MKNTPSDNMTFGERLAYARKKKGLLQKELAELSGVSYASIMHYEQDRQTPRSARLRKIIKALEVSDDWFENDDKIKPTKKLTNFGQRLAYTRKKKGLLQKELAELSGVSYCSIMGYEEDKHTPCSARLRKIIKALEVSDDWFENDDNFKDHDIERVKKLTNFGQRLAYTRKKKGLNQTQLGALIGGGITLICRLETGRITPNASMLRKIVKALEVSDDWFENDDNFKPVKKLTNFGQRLAYTRKKKGLKQSQLAELIGVGDTKITYLENDFQYPSVSLLSKIIKALGVSDDWFENDDNFKHHDKGHDVEPVKKLTKEQQQLVAENEWIIRYLFYNFFHYPKNQEKYEDYYGYAAISLCETAMLYDKTKGSFSTLARMKIQFYMSNAYRSEKKDIQPFTSLDKPFGDDPDCKTLNSIVSDPEDKIEQLEHKILVESVCQKIAPVLTDKEHEVFRLWLHGASMDEIAAAVGASFATVTRRKREVVKKCRTLFTPTELFS